MELFNVQAQNIPLIERLTNEILDGQRVCESFMYSDSQGEVNDAIETYDVELDGIDVSFEHQYGGEGLGSTYVSVIKFTSGTEVVYIKFYGNYQSHYGVDYEGWEQVQPYEQDYYTWVETKTFNEPAVADFVKKLKETFDEDDSIPDDLMDHYSGVNDCGWFSHVSEDYYGGEDQGDEYWIVRKLTDVQTGATCYVKFYGSYASYYGSEYEGFMFVESKPSKRNIWVGV